jgi:hypothetical protein
VRHENRGASGCHDDYEYHTAEWGTSWRPLERGYLPPE